MGEGGVGRLGRGEEADLALEGMGGVGRWMNGWMGGWVDGWRWMDGWMDGCVDGWMTGWVICG